MTEVEDTTLPRHVGSPLHIPAASVKTKNGIFTDTAAKNSKFDNLSQFPCLPKILTLCAINLSYLTCFCSNFELVVILVQEIWPGCHVRAGVLS
jgi:hypothetical protein